MIQILKLRFCTPATVRPMDFLPGRISSTEPASSTMPVNIFSEWSDSGNRQQLDFKNKCGLGWNRSRVPVIPIGQVRRNREFGFFAHLHRRHAPVPTLDHLPRSEHKGEWFTAINRAV